MIEATGLLPTQMKNGGIINVTPQGWRARAVDRLETVSKLPSKA
jgi:hypothetical protein